MGQRRDQKKFSAYANRNQRASEIVGNAASAMATCFLSFKTIDRTYANKCLVTAKSLYNLASKYPGSFINGGWAAQSPSMNSHLSSYRSSGLYKDELANAAALLYLATNETSYLKFAKEYFNQALREYKGNLAFFSWDDKLVSTALLLCQINNRRGNGYELLLQKAFNFWLPDCVGARCKPGDGPSAKCKCIFRTPKGLTVGDSWGSLAAATNIGFLMMQHARWLRKFDVSDAYAVKLVNFVISQVNYVLGDNNGWSFMTGFGNKYPQHTYNVASYNSIIDFPLRGKRPDVIAQDYFLQGTSPQYDTPQRFIPYGAIQGGPDYYNDGIVDNHENYTFTENAQDYASAFLGAAIGLVDVYNLTTKGTDCGLDLGWNHPNANKAKRYPKYRKGDLYHTCG